MPTTALELAAELAISGRQAVTSEMSEVEEVLITGSNGFDAMTAEFTFGTGNSEAEEWWVDERTLGATTSESLDMAGGLVSQLHGGTLTFHTVKLIVVAIDAPDGAKELRVGPQNVANAFQGPFGGGGATVYKAVRNWEVVVNDPFGGYAVGAGSTDLLVVNNQTAGPITYRILIVGEV